jgi:hypothetical protein
MVVPFGGGTPVVVAVLVHKGMPVSAMAALLLASATRAHLDSPRARGVAAVMIAALAVPLGELLARCTLPSLHELGRHHQAGYEWASSVVLATWIAVDLARSGPRTWLTYGSVIWSLDKNQVQTNCICN